MADLSTAPSIGREITDDDRVRWVQFWETCKAEPLLLPFIERDQPELYDRAMSVLRSMAVEVVAGEWRSPLDGVGGRPEQLIPGTPGSFSDAVDWVVWLLMGGRGSGKTRTGAEAVREFLTEREWTEPPMGALVGQRLDSVRVDMVERTLLEVLPPGSVRLWRRSTVEVLLTNGGYLRGFSSEAPRNLRGPNFHFAWADEIATWIDADRSPQALDTTWSNMLLAVRKHDHHTWRPRVIATTTPRPVRLIRNPAPDDPNNPGPGLYDDELTVVSNMSTMANLANLADHFYRAIIAPLKGTRLHAQEVDGILQDAVLGALWLPEDVERMVAGVDAHETVGRGLVRVVVAVDPSIGAGTGDECGIVVAGLARDGRVYVLADLSGRMPAKVWAGVVKGAAVRFGAEAVVAEVNQGGELVGETLGRYAPNLPVKSVWAKRGKRLRAEPVALLSDQGRLRFCGGRDLFGSLMTQMQTWDPESGGDSPDRLDAMVYAALDLLPAETGAGELMSVVQSVATR